MAAPYLSTLEASDLLLRYNIEGVFPGEGRLRAASDRLDFGQRPFIGSKYSPTQARQFPRSETLADDVAGQVPDDVKRWVALEAYKLTQPDSPPLTSEPIPSVGQLTYARPARSDAERYQDGLLDRYKVRTALLRG
jgi:hypothetical protein